MTAAALSPWRRRAGRLHPDPAHARHRRADLRPGGDAGPDAGDHRAAAQDARSAHLRRRRRLSIVRSQRNAPAALNPLIKSNNLLNNALAMQRALAHGGFEAVMRNHRGELAECSQSNLFVVSGGVVRTPPLEAGLLAGITRQFVLDLCREARVPVDETTLHDADLLEADEAFITSSTREIVPAVKVDHTVINDGCPGRITRALMAAFHARVEQLSATPENSR